MKLNCKVLLFTSLFSAQSFAANVQEIWSLDTKPLAPFAIDNAQAQNTQAKLYQPIAPAKASQELLQLHQALVDNQGNSHVRYNQYYQGVPIFGMQVIYHTGKANAPQVTGSLLSDIAKDLPQVAPKYPAEALLNLAQQQFRAQQPSVRKTWAHTHKLVIYPGSTAKLAYAISFMAQTDQGLMKPLFIIDANNREVLSFWDDLQREEIGQGEGGNTKQFSLRPNQFQYGQGLAGPSLGKLDITYQNGTCTMKNLGVQVINARHKLDEESFPVSVEDDAKYPAFSYACSADTGYVNANDDGYAPVNGGFSPMNDSLYFATQTFKMLQEQFGIAKPFGDDLPIRVYTHFDDGSDQRGYINAFAIPKDDALSSDGIHSHQQVGIGNGGKTDYPLTQGTVAHELCHLMTANFSNLIYAKQSGGMNEAFSDICNVTVRYNQNLKYAWYKYDWNIDLEISKFDTPYRCVDKPTCDGYSIDNFANYYDGLDVHLSSGIYNKAFYLLSTTPGWTINKAFSVMADANMFYWTPNSTFNNGCFGVAQAARNRGYNAMDVVKAFRNVGVSCKF